MYSSHSGLSRRSRRLGSRRLGVISAALKGTSRSPRRTPGSAGIPHTARRPCGNRCKWMTPVSSSSTHSSTELKQALLTVSSASGRCHRLHSHRRIPPESQMVMEQHGPRLAFAAQLVIFADVAFAAVVEQYVSPCSRHL